MITIHKSGIDGLLEERELLRLQLEFRKNDFMRLPNLIGNDLIEELYSQMSIAEWEDRIHDGIGTEICLADRGIVALFNFLFNDQDLFKTIGKITGCGYIGCFEGRVYRMIPDRGHHDSWHTDFGEGRLLALSLNLGKEPYEGGTLQIQPKESTDLPIEVPNIHFGDAVLFRLSDKLKHRITNVTGNVPKTAFAGWFKSAPDLWSRLNDLSQSNQTHPAS
jgi:2-oxoglutarate-Fe(II)-dependent oxygenase superfamily protein